MLLVSQTEQQQSWQHGSAQGPGGQGVLQHTSTPCPKCVMLHDGIATALDNLARDTPLQQWLISRDNL